MECGGADVLGMRRFPDEGENAGHGGRLDQGFFHEVVGEVEVAINLLFEVVLDSEDGSKHVVQFFPSREPDVGVVELANRRNGLRVILGKHLFEEPELDGLGFHEDTVFIENKKGEVGRHER